MMGVKGQRQYLPRAHANGAEAIARPRRAAAARAVQPDAADTRYGDVIAAAQARAQTPPAAQPAQEDALHALQDEGGGEPVRTVLQGYQDLVRLSGARARAMVVGHEHEREAEGRSAAFTQFSARDVPLVDSDRAGSREGAPASMALRQIM